MNPHLLIAGPSGLPSAGSLRAYVRVWKTLRGMNPAQALSRGFADPWPTAAGEELNRFREALDNRINTRGLLDGHWVRSISVRDPREGTLVHREARTLRHLQRTVVHSCRWCGSPLPKYRVPTHRFCNLGCFDDWRG